MGEKPLLIDYLKAKRNKCVPSLSTSSSLLVREELTQCCSPQAPSEGEGYELSRTFARTNSYIRKAAVSNPIPVYQVRHFLMLQLAQTLDPKC